VARGGERIIVPTQSTQVHGKRAPKYGKAVEGQGAMVRGIRV